MIADEGENLVRQERIVGIALLFLFATLTVIDVYEDLLDGAPLVHVASELLIVLCCIGGCLYLWRRARDAWSAKAAGLTVALEHAFEDAQKWRAANAALTQGFSAAIDKQFNDWGLSLAQKDISLLLIKGMSFKEIANARESSEHTVRQQAAAIYRKSGLEGRAQLSAFFLEDLLTPVQEFRRLG